MHQQKKCQTLEHLHINLNMHKKGSKCFIIWLIIALFSMDLMMTLLDKRKHPWMIALQSKKDIPATFCCSPLEHTLNICLSYSGIDIKLFDLLLYYLGCQDDFTWWGNSSIDGTLPRKSSSISLPSFVAPLTRIFPLYFRPSLASMMDLLSLARYSNSLYKSAV